MLIAEHHGSLWVVPSWPKVYLSECKTSIHRSDRLDTVRYAPNRGAWIQNVKISEVVTPQIVVNSGGLAFKVRYPNPFDNYHIIALTHSETETVMSLWFKNPLEMYINCVNFAVFCVTSGLGISLEHLRSSQPLAASIVRFHLYYHVRKILYALKVKLPSEKGFEKYATKHDNEAFRDICTDYGVDPKADYRNGYISSSYQGSRLTPLNGDSWSRWIMPKSEGLTRQGVEMLSESIRVYVYCLLTAQSLTRSNIIGNTSQNFEAQKLFGKEVEDFVEKDTLLLEDIRRYEGILSNARSSVDFSLGSGIYLLPSDLRLKVVKKKGFSDKLRVGETDQAGIVVPKRLTTVHPKKPLTLREQRLSLEHQDERQSLVLFGSLVAVGVSCCLLRKHAPLHR